MLVPISTKFSVLLLSVGHVLAETAPGFPIQLPASSPSLSVAYGTNTVSPPGELLPRPDTANAPDISSPVWWSGDQGVLLLVDIDVPRNGTRVELLHWLVSNVTIDKGTSRLIIPNQAEAPYLQPSPPVGDIPHAYSFILFSQPDGFSVPAEFNEVLESRIFFNVSAFVAATGLGQRALAANYIRVQNLTGTPTTTFPPPRPTNGTNDGDNGTQAPPETFPGGAPGAVLGGGSLFWAGLIGSIGAGFAAFAL